MVIHVDSTNKLIKMIMMILTEMMMMNLVLKSKILIMNGANGDCVIALMHGEMAILVMHHDVNGAINHCFILLVKLFKR